MGPLKLIKPSGGPAEARGIGPKPIPQGSGPAKSQGARRAVGREVVHSAYIPAPPAQIARGSGWRSWRAPARAFR